MGRRAKLSLSPESVGAEKEAPRLDPAPADARSRDEAPERSVRRRKRAARLDARRIAQVVLVAAVGALSIYLITRRVSRRP